MKIKLNSDKIRQIFFDARHQDEIINELHKLIPENHKGICNYKTWQFFFETCVKFDEHTHIGECMPGGCWINNGFICDFDNNSNLEYLEVFCEKM